MPVKARTGKRRSSPQAEAEAWALTFKGGVDFLGDLMHLGFAWGQMFDDDPFRSAAEDAWRRLGHLFLASPENDGPQPCWAEEQFGLPDAYQPD